MRKLLFAVVIVGIVLGMNSCDEEDPNPFIGTWISENDYKFIFTETNMTVYRPNGDLYWTGTYTYDDTKIRTKLDTTISHPEMVVAADDGIFITRYFFEGDKLSLNGNPCTKIN